MAKGKLLLIIGSVALVGFILFKIFYCPQCDDCELEVFWDTKKENTENKIGVDVGADFNKLLKDIVDLNAQIELEHKTSEIQEVANALPTLSSFANIKKNIICAKFKIYKKVNNRAELSEIDKLKLLELEQLDSLLNYKNKQETVIDTIIIEQPIEKQPIPIPPAPKPELCTDTTSGRIFFEGDKEGFTLTYNGTVLDTTQASGYYEFYHCKNDIRKKCGETIQVEFTKNTENIQKIFSVYLCDRQQTNKIITQ